MRKSITILIGTHAPASLTWRSSSQACNSCLVNQKSRASVYVPVKIIGGKKLSNTVTIAQITALMSSLTRRPPGEGLGGDCGLRPVHRALVSERTWRPGRWERRHAEGRSRLVISASDPAESRCPAMQSLEFIKNQKNNIFQTKLSLIWSSISFSSELSDEEYSVTRRSNVPDRNFPCRTGKLLFWC